MVYNGKMPRSKSLIIFRPYNLVVAVGQETPLIEWEYVKSTLPSYTFELIFALTLLLFSLIRELDKTEDPDKWIICHLEKFAPHHKHSLSCMHTSSFESIYTSASPSASPGASSEAAAYPSFPPPNSIRTSSELTISDLHASSDGTHFTEGDSYAIDGDGDTYSSTTPSEAGSRVSQTYVVEKAPG